MKASDIDTLLSPGRPSIDPARARALVSVTRANLEANAYTGQLWSVPLDGSGPERLTRGFRDTAPALSPDGLVIAFLRATDRDDHAQLMAMPADGGEPVRLSHAPLGVEEFSWSPDSASIAYTARCPERERYGTEPGIGPEDEAPRTFADVGYKRDGIGYVSDRRQHVFIVDLPDLTAEPQFSSATGESKGQPAPGYLPASRQITRGDSDYESPRFLPSGDELIVLSAQHENREHDLRSSVLALDLATSQTRELVEWPHALSIESLDVSPDGRVFLIAAQVGESGRDFVGRSLQLFMVEDGQALALTDPDSVDLGEPGANIAFAPDGSILATTRARGAVQLITVTRFGNTVPLTSGDSCVEAVACAGEDIVLTYTDPSTPGDLATVQGEVWNQISDFGAAVRRSGLIEPEEYWVTGRDGTALHGWCVAAEADQPRPVILMIHGGPFSAYRAAVFDEAQVLADAGYAVVMCNPRGSAGYGQDYARAIRGRLGSVDEADVLDFLDGVRAVRDDLDSDQIGIMGGSYGGYLTAWITTHEHRFSAAIVERGFLDPVAFIGTSDIGMIFTDEYCGTDIDSIRSQSPQEGAGGVDTPTLVIHSEKDLRCPLPQAESYFATLVRNSVPAEFTVFPGEDHELTRSGTPRHRVQRFDKILDWWSHYMPTAENPE